MCGWHPVIVPFACSSAHNSWPVTVISASRKETKVRLSLSSKCNFLLGDQALNSPCHAVALLTCMCSHLGPVIPRQRETSCSGSPLEFRSMLRPMRGRDEHSGSETSPKKLSFVAMSEPPVQEHSDGQAYLKCHHPDQPYASPKIYHLHLQFG
jgi:hypothetical protein